MSSEPRVDAHPRRVLICQHRFPEHDRERGSLRVMELIGAFQSLGWSVTFVSTDASPAPRYERELIRRGVVTLRGWDERVAALLATEPVDLVVAVFWHVAAHVIGDVRSWSPGTPVLVDSVDLHFVREARRRVVALDATSSGETADVTFDPDFGELARGELAAYAAADGVLVVSHEERELVDAVLGRPSAHVVELGETTTPSNTPLTDRRGLLFVGNFRHLPNAEGLRWFRDEVVPLLDPATLRRHPLRVVGNALDDDVRDIAAGIAHAAAVGWVPDLRPEFDRCRVVVVPVRHGAGVKGKTLQAFAAGTPVVSTGVGVEGLAIIAGEHAAVADDPHQFAAAIEALLRDDDRWMRQRTAALSVAAHHQPAAIEGQLARALDHITQRTTPNQQSAPLPIDRNQHAGTEPPGGNHAPSGQDRAAPELATASPGLAAVTTDAVASHSQDADLATITVVIATRDRAELLDRCLSSFCDQDLDPDRIELIVVDDGSVDDTAATLDRWMTRRPWRRARTPGLGRSAAKNRGLELATGDVVVLFDDDDEATPGLCRAHLEAHRRHPGIGDAVLGHTEWAPDLNVTSFMHHITDVGHELFSYPTVPTDRPLDWRHFWEGRISIKRALVETAAHSGIGLHDESLEYTIDIEWALRLRTIAALQVHYVPDARSHMTRPVGIDDFLRRARAKGRSQFRISELHPTDEIRAYCGIESMGEWHDVAGEIDDDLRWLAEHADTEPDQTGSGRRAAIDPERSDCYRRLIRAHNIWGLVDGRTATTDRPTASIIVPVWSATDHLAEMAQRTVDRVRDVSEPGAELIVVDDASPHQPPPAGDVTVRHAHNRGVAASWNHGMRVATGDVLIVLNSDCVVEPGWDRALRHAALDGSRIVFPYTDHGDGDGFRRPDQAGTAGWCFALSRATFDMLGPFDTQFTPAFFEDADFWHRAMDAGVELSPVPAARVRHERRTSAQHLDDVDAVFERNRRRYEAKHGVGFNRPPPYFARTIVDYPPPAHHRLAVLGGMSASDAATLDPDEPGRPRVFGVGISKTATSSLHAALAHLGMRSIHHGDPEFRAAIDHAIGTGRAPLHRVDTTIDAFVDVPAIVDHVAEFDRWYPASRFVLTVRDEAALIESHERHAADNRRRRDAGEPHGTLLEVDPAELTERYRRHVGQITTYFAERPGDLLVMDICGGDGWESLAPFLGWQRLPERPFPHENPSGTANAVAADRTARVAIP